MSSHRRAVRFVALAVWTVFVAGCSVSLPQQTAIADDEPPIVAAGYTEAVFSVSSIAAYQEFFTAVAGWEVVLDGAVPAEQLTLWQLPAEARARQVLMANPGTTRGFVRLVQFANVEQQIIRSNAQSWDTGGWFDVNSRVTDMQARFAEFMQRGWQATSDPVQFSFGRFVVKEWLARGPDGIVVAVIERIQPPLTGWPNLRRMSRIFNATQIVADMAAAREFYVDKLGFKVYLTSNKASDAPGPNVLGLPYNIATTVPRDVLILNPQGNNEGSVELLAFEGLTGADWSARAQPPNLGILMLRFPVTSMAQFYAHARAVNLDVVAPPQTVTIEPYGRVPVLAVRGPGGAWIEFFEQPSAPTP